MNKYIKNITLCAMVAGAGMLASCEDFLTITPTSSIVEEEFWQDKNDLNNAVMGCYKHLVSYDLLEKYILWGEMRGDNFERSSTSSATGQVPNIMNANLLPTYGLFNWEQMYKEINYCNKVLAHGPEVVANDESFSNGDWTPIKAEAIALRALGHFYLVRTFGEIPYVTQDYNNDSQELRLKQSTQLQVLDSIINDLESIKDVAMRDYGNTVENKGRITRKAVYALLADVYLWRASYKTGNCTPFKNRMVPSYNTIYNTDEKFDITEDYKTTAEYDYQKCIECCDMVIDITTKEKIDYINKHGLNVGGGEIKLYPEDLLEQSVPSTTSNIAEYDPLGAYHSIFGVGNSDESIFELQVEGTSYGNATISGLFWNSANSRSGALSGSTALFESVEPSPNILKPTYIFTKTDYRKWEDIRYTTGTSQTAFNIWKYTNTYVTQSVGVHTMLTDNNSTLLKVNNNPQSGFVANNTMNYKSNWIMYRMSEIYLMKAEAMSQLSEEEENLYEAFKYVREVFKRSNPIAYSPTNPSTTKSNDSLVFETFASKEGIEKLVLAERQREFVGEGKRWFDLVRYAQRHGSTKDMLEYLTRKYASNSKSIAAKLASMQSLFSPVYENELKNNTWLYQNGVWETSSSTSKTDNL